jgi:hypothetical protein
MDQRSGGGRAGHKDNGSVGRDLERQAEERIEDLRVRFDELNERLTGFIRERPGTSLLVALGAGFLIGRMLRS